MAAAERGQAAPQPSLERMRRFDIRPRRRLGQNFLIDNNILDVIAASSALSGQDVVLEVGGGLGVLSEYLADRAAFTHVIELDESLRPALEDALSGRTNVDLIFADAVEIDFASLDPRPNKLIANLPYNIAARSVIKAFHELPELELCCVMTQREVAERLVSPPGGRLYGASSVLTQAVASQSEQRRLSRNIFHPVPNVDSSLVTFRRSRPNPPAGFTELVHDAFAHRRKPLAGSLALARRDDDSSVKARAAAALERLGLPADTRAERLSADQFLELGALIGESA